MPPQTSVEMVGQAILAYLRQHPGAADTVEGIACWWLPTSLRRDDEIVAQALKADGLIQCRTNVDQRRIYSNLAKRPPA